VPGSDEIQHEPEQDYGQDAEGEERGDHHNFQDTFYCPQHTEAEKTARSGQK